MAEIQHMGRKTISHNFTHLPLRSVSESHASMFTVKFCLYVCPYGQSWPDQLASHFACATLSKHVHPLSFRQLWKCPYRLHGNGRGRRGPPTIPKKARLQQCWEELPCLQVTKQDTKQSYPTHTPPHPHSTSILPINPISWKSGITRVARRLKTDFYSNVPHMTVSDRNRTLFNHITILEALQH